MSNLVSEILLRLAKAGVTLVLALVLYLVLVALGGDASITLGLLCWLSASAFVLLVQESPL